MSRRLTLILILFSLCRAPGLTWAQQRGADEPAPAGEVYSSLDPGPLAWRERQMAVFDDVWRIVRDRYYDSSLHGVDWVAAADAYRPQAARARSSTEFYGVLRRMLNRLRDSHTRVYAPEEKFNWYRPRFLSTGVTVREVDGRFVIATVDPDSAAKRAGVRPGDQIVRVGDRPPAEIFDRLLAEEVSASRPATARFQAVAMLLDGPLGVPVAVRLRAGEGDREQVVKLPRVERERVPELRVRRAADANWLVEFNAFTPQIAADWTRALRHELREARGLVVDLRQNGGGEAEAMVEILSTLLPPGVDLGHFTDRAGRVYLDPRTRSALLFSADRIPRFDGPIVILTSEKTASAAEIFAAVMKKTGRAPLVGAQTCGCVLGVARARALPDGGTLALSEMDYRTAAGARLEGEGVAPDERTPLTLDDIRRRRDAALTKALQLLPRD